MMADLAVSTAVPAADVRVSYTPWPFAVVEVLVVDVVPLVVPDIDDGRYD